MGEVRGMHHYSLEKSGSIRVEVGELSIHINSIQNSKSENFKAPAVSSRLNTGFKNTVYPRIMYAPPVAEVFITDMDFQESKHCHENCIMHSQNNSIS